jgi:quercetin dioxygenase-like cupin family protein
MTDAVRIIDARDVSAHPVLPIVEDEQGEARAIVWPGIGANDRSLHQIRLAPGARTVELAHPSEAVYYVVEGSGEVTEGGPCPADPALYDHIEKG